uniref:Protein-S-isoprenylcysteine O-methyltransferase n=1 Tax=Strigamia maritima TaxID=126957 RepID=T1IQK6_STRMM
MVAIRSFGLGFVFGVAVLLSLWAESRAVSFGWYLCLLSFFHISEYVTTAMIVLCNPICLIGYTIASWNFFNERIYEEELILLNFFGKDYVKYQKKVPTGLPFISGFRVEN